MHQSNLEHIVVGVRQCPRRQWSERVDAFATLNLSRRRCFVVCWGFLQIHGEIRVIAIRCASSKPVSLQGPFLFRRRVKSFYYALDRFFTWAGNSTVFFYSLLWGLISPRYVIICLFTRCGCSSKTYLPISLELLEEVVTGFASKLAARFIFLAILWSDETALVGGSSEAIDFFKSRQVCTLLITMVELFAWKTFDLKLSSSKNYLDYVRERGSKWYFWH